MPNQNLLDLSRNVTHYQKKDQKLDRDPAITEMIELASKDIKTGFITMYRYLKKILSH